ncbi:MAG TPA: LrgB family protein [Chthoniobacterales bacterium]
MSLVVWSILTIAIYFAIRWIFLKTRQSLLHPVLWGTVALIALIELTGHSYKDYAAETQWLVWLLGPAVVALAVPVYKMRGLIFSNFVPLAVVVVIAVLFSVVSIDLMLFAFPLDRAVIKSLTLKSITAPVAFELSRENGGIPELTAIGVMFAGIMGAILGPWVLRISKVNDPKAIGLALGTTSHGVGTARALELGETHGAFASIGMSCSAMAASVICPILLKYLI